MRTLYLKQVNILTEMKFKFCALLIVLAVGCSQPQTAESSDPVQENNQQLIDGKFVHMVFFWLNEGVDVQAFMDGTELFLKEVEVVKSYHLGTPAMTPREVVDNSYSVCLVVTFDSKEDQDIYQEHEAHVKYVEEMKDSWHTVKIFDSFAY